MLLDTHAGLGVASVWETDGTAASTRFVGQITLLRLTAYQLIESEDRLWFAGSSSTTGDVAIFEMSGTPLANQLVTTLPSTSLYAFTAQMVAARDRLWIATSDQLFALDPRTRAVTTIPLPTNVFRSVDGSLAVVGSRIVFIGVDSLGLSGLWASDGTSTGTRLLATQDVRVVSARSMADRPQLAGGNLWVAARDAIAGLEPHVIELGAVAVPSSCACGGASRAGSLLAESAPIRGSR